MTNPNLPEGTYGVRCEFHTGSQAYTYLVDPSQGIVQEGDDVVVASPSGGYKVVHVIDIAEDLAPVKLEYMKYIVQRIDHTAYDRLMKALTGPPPHIDEGDTMNVGNPQR